MLMMPLPAAVGLAGAALAHRLGKRALELGFGAFLFIVASRFAFA